MAKKKKWIQKMNLDEGSLTKTAKEKGGYSKQKDKIKKSFLEKAADGKYGDKTQKRAQLALNFRKMG